MYDPGVLASLPMVLDGSDPGFASEMLELFIQDARKTLVAIDQADSGSDWTSMTRLVHSLKSSAAQVGALAISDQARVQEALLRAGRFGAPDWRDRLRLALEQFEGAVAQQDKTP